MGSGHEVLDQLNERWKEWGEVLDPGLEWTAIARAMGFLEELDKSSVAFIDAWPAELRDVMVGLLASASRSRAQLRFAWVPGYDFEVRIAKANAVDGEPEYTVLLSSPYPGEVLRGR